MSMRWVFAAMLGIVVMVPTAEAGPRSCDRRVNDTPAKMLECVTLEGVREHQAALQAIADAQGGNRRSGLPGFDASVAYVVATLEAAGYEPVIQDFDIMVFDVLGVSALEQTAPVPTNYVQDVDFDVIDQSDPGDVTAAVTAVDLQLGIGNTSTSGCEAADFAGFPAGNIALLQRGTCTFELKAENAAAAGAVGIVIFNQGNTDAPDRNNIPAVTLTVNNTSGIPVLGTTYFLGQTLSLTPGLVMRVFANTFREVTTTYNVFAETSFGNDHNVVMAGAHLDSVDAGPGINANGSGSAALLEVAEQMKKVRPINTVRFAWWGAHESGLVGSTFYLEGLTDEERADIALYLDFNTVGSPNYVRFIYDGDGSVFGGGPPAGSGAIEALFEGFYGDRGLASQATALDGRSDYAPFQVAGIPVGGIFTGAEGIKTAEQAAIFGGTAGVAYDACYHAACDTYDNVSTEVLDLNSDAIALAVITYAMDTTSVNGVGAP
jgi:Zn-dependent M28 family amino/carboxypeptidase